MLLITDLGGGWMRFIPLCLDLTRTAGVYVSCADASAGVCGFWVDQVARERDWTHMSPMLGSSQLLVLCSEALFETDLLSCRWRKKYVWSLWARSHDEPGRDVRVRCSCCLSLLLVSSVHAGSPGRRVRNRAGWAGKGVCRTGFCDTDLCWS